MVYIIYYTLCIIYYSHGINFYDYLDNSVLQRSCLTCRNFREMTPFADLVGRAQVKGAAAPSDFSCNVMDSICQKMSEGDAQYFICVFCLRPHL